MIDLPRKIHAGSQIAFDSTLKWHLLLPTLNELGWPRETNAYKLCGKLFDDQGLVLPPPTKEQQFSIEKFIRDCLKQLKKLHDRDVKYLFRILTDVNQHNPPWLSKYRILQTIKRLEHDTNDIQDKPQWSKPLQAMKKLFKEEGNVHTWISWLLKIFRFGVCIVMPIREHLRIECQHAQQVKRILTLNGRVSRLNRLLEEKKEVNERLLAQIEK